MLTVERLDDYLRVATLGERGLGPDHSRWISGDTVRVDGDSKP